MPRIRPQAGPQETFSASTADIAFYGGSAGGGKTWALAYEAARYVSVPSYTAAIFRRTRPQLVGGGSIWEESKKLYPHLGGEPRESPTLDWRFPSGALIEFHHLQHESTVYDHQSKQYSFLGFDEVTHDTAFQFWYMLSRLRSGGTSIPKRVRATCNPDPDSFVRGLVDWWIGEDGLAIEERSGVIRWLARIDDELVWADTPDELVTACKGRVRRRGEPPRDEHDLRAEPMSFTFIRAKASDNRILMRADPTYLSRLALIPGAEKRRLLFGDWNAKDSAGDYFNRTTFPIVERIDEANVVRRVRFWDKAATSPSASNPDPDWTVGSRVAELDDGSFAIEDRIAVRTGPAAVIELMKSTAELDGRECIIGHYLDPGQAGKVDAEFTARELFGFAVQTVPATKSKETFAAVWSPLAMRGKVKVVRREYLPELFGILEGFPTLRRDDDVDSLSGCFQILTGGGFAVGYDAATDPRHPFDAVDGEDRFDDDDDDEGGSSRAGGYF